MASDRQGAARALGEEILEALERLLVFPSSGRAVPELASGEHRELIVGPVRLVYRVAGEEVRILACVHASRRMGPELLGEAEEG